MEAGSTIVFDVQVTVRDGRFVAFCPSLEAEGIGLTREEAMESLKVLAERKVKDVLPLYKNMT
jgi:predicted RNase H-like HicB family nuclease